MGIYMIAAMFNSKLGLGVQVFIFIEELNILTEYCVNQWGNTLLALIALVIGLVYPVFL